MAKYEKSFDSEDSNTIFQAGNDLRCHNIAGDSRDKDVANRLVKDKLHRHARISAGEHRGKGLLFTHGMFFQDRQVMLNRCQLICCKTLVTGEQFLQS